MSELAWYCLHTKSKTEHIAATVLTTRHGVETYCPRIRFERTTARGKVWFVEALFPRYVFARFDMEEMSRAVKYSHNVVRIVEFGEAPIPLPDQVISDLKEEMAFQEIVEVRRSIEVGDEVELTEGPMRGLKGIVHSVLSGQDRVRILLDFLGRQNPVELPASKLLADRSARGELAWQRYGGAQP
jgi:transcriptional antiterminator RfaH